jgi:hypothetical protein
MKLCIWHGNRNAHSYMHLFIWYMQVTQIMHYCYYDRSDNLEAWLFVWCNILAQGLTGLIGHSYQQVTTSFLEAHPQRTPS